MDVKAWFEHIWSVPNVACDNTFFCIDQAGTTWNKRLEFKVFCKFYQFFVRAIFFISFFVTEMSDENFLLTSLAHKNERNAKEYSRKSEMYQQKLSICEKSC